jgi:uncharacterized protein
MAYYLYRCEDIADREEAARIRREILQDHLSYVEKNIESYAVAGPNRDTDGAYRSSTFVITAASLPRADALMAHDPYVLAGLYLEFRGVEFMPVAGAWVGGVAWK